MSTAKLFEEQVKKFHEQMVELVKKYQFRDRNQMTCCGISVSQCYILEALHRHGDLNMKKLAKKMHLSVSTVTRVIEPLVRRGFVSRVKDINDKRVRLISLTDNGKQIYKEAWGNVFESEGIILGNFPAEHRSRLIELLQKLNKAITNWQSSCCGQ
jgi:DNA-binding MarR family transcriptional regulator